jgi:TonB family protein
MRMRYFLVRSVLIAGLSFAAGITSAQDSLNQVERKIVKQTIPRYPVIARKMNLSGTVKVVAVIEPDGKVKTVQPMGGSPILIQAAQDAVSQWKFAAAGGESRQVVEVHFNPVQPN